MLLAQGDTGNLLQSCELNLKPAMHLQSKNRREKLPNCNHIMTVSCSTAGQCGMPIWGEDSVVYLICGHPLQPKLVILFAIPQLIWGMGAPTWPITTTSPCITSFSGHWQPNDSTIPFNAFIENQPLYCVLSNWEQKQWGKRWKVKKFAKFLPKLCKCLFEVFFQLMHGGRWKIES